MPASIGDRVLQLKSMPASPALPVPRFDQFYRHEELTRLLHDYAAALPQWVELQSLGKSRGGHDLWIATVSDSRAGDPDRKPALVVCVAANGGPEPALFAIARLLSDAEARPEFAELLRRRTVYVVPAVDPDVVQKALRGRGDQMLTVFVLRFDRAVKAIIARRVA